MMQTGSQRLIRLPREVKKAIFAGDGYVEYKTILQFHRKAESILQRRIEAMEVYLDRFLEEGGGFEQWDGGCRVSMGDVTYTVEFGPRGVARYSVENPTGNEEAMRYLHGLFFTLYTLPIYRRTLARIQEGLSDMENSTVLRGIGELRDIIRDDRYLTVASVSGLEVRVEDEMDPFEVFGDGS